MYAVLYDDQELVISNDKVYMSKSILVDYGEFDEKHVPWMHDFKHIYNIEFIRILNQINVSDMTMWFYAFKNLRELISFQNLDTSTCKKFSLVFAGCESLETLDALKYLNVANGINFSNMFMDCRSLKNLSGLQDWNIHSAETFSGMFSNCIKLTSIVELQNWNVSNCKNFSNMFYDCINAKLKQTDAFKDWNVSVDAKLNGIFEFCAFTKIILPPSWPILEYCQFERCCHLEKIEYRNSIYSYVDLKTYENF